MTFYTYKLNLILAAQQNPRARGRSKTKVTEKVQDFNYKPY